MTPTLASLFIGEWFGPAPTIIGLVLLAFWAWVKWSNRPVERLNFRFMGVVLLVISSSLWLGFEKGGASTTGYGGDFGAFFAGRFADGWIGTLAMFFVGLAALLSIPLATDWLFLPMFLKYRTKQGLAAAPVLGSVGGYKIVGAYAHEGSSPPAPPAASGAPDAAAADAESNAGDAAATAVAEREPTESDEEPAHAAQADDDVAPPAPAADADLPWYMRRRPRGSAASAPRTADDDLAPRTSVARTREETTARFQLEPEPEPAPMPTYESRRRSRASRYAEPEVEPATEPGAETRDSESDENATNDADAASFRASAVAEPETYEETEADAVPSIDEIARAPVAKRTEQPEVPAAATELDAAIDDAFGFADDSPRATAAEPVVPTIEEAASAAPTEVEPTRSESPTSVDAVIADEATDADDDAPDDSAFAADDAAEDDDEAAAVAEAEPTTAPAPSVEAEPAPVAVTLSDDDLAFVKAGDLVVGQSKASISFLQKQLGVGYFQAAKLLDRLEKEKIIGPYTGGVNRDVLIDLVEWQAKKSSMG
ncbi:MAG: hypothetical protein IPH13_05095 [Planctomycetes bacterium]|nr:hypothetical protein [Planctomycetota bacterium]